MGTCYDPAQAAEPGTARSFAIDSHPAVLGEIGRSDVALVIWDRIMADDLAAAMATLCLDAIETIEAELPAERTAASLEPLLAASGYGAEATRLVADDVAGLIARLAALTGAHRVAIRLARIETDACRRFHADYKGLRLLCTYIGPGTEWRCTEDAGPSRRLAPGAVAVFKGRLLMEPPLVLHRSPPLSETGGKRLLLVLDPVEADTR